MDFGGGGGDGGGIAGDDDIGAVLEGAEVRGNRVPCLAAHYYCICDL